MTEVLVSVLVSFVGGYLLGMMIYIIYVRLRRRN